MPSMKKPKTLTLDALTFRGAKAPEVLARQIMDELDKWEFGAVDTSIRSILDKIGFKGTNNVFSTLSRNTILKDYSYLMSYKHYVYGSRATITALKAGEAQKKERK